MTPLTQPREHIQYIRNELESHRELVGDSSNRRDTLAEADWRSEELIAKANYLFSRIIALDLELQEWAFSEKGMEEEPVGDVSLEILRDWLTMSNSLISHVERLEQCSSDVAGVKEFRSNIKQAIASLTPDDQFFVGEKLARLRDEAIDNRRAGNTESFDVSTPA